jgi:PAS domain S-box-containing protein
MEQSLPAQEDRLSPRNLRLLYRRHFQGALVRSGASVAMWIFALAGFVTGLLKTNHFAGITISVLYLILINPPTLFLLKKIARRRPYAYCSISINFLEIIGYTAVIYSVGGIEATYLTIIYAALITYVGIVSPKYFPYLIAALCSFVFSSMVILEYLGFLPHQNVNPVFDPQWPAQLLYSSVIVGLLFVVAYISSYTAGLLKRNRDKLRRQNKELEEKAHKIEQTDKELHLTHQELEKRVQERTSELVEANARLTQEIDRRIQAQTSLEKSEEKYRDLFNNVSDFIYVHDLEGNFLEANLVFKERLGITEDELSGLNARDIMPEKYRNQFDDYLRRIGDQGKDEGFYRVIGKEGEEIVIEYKNSIVYDADGNIHGVRGSGRDVTERILAEKERKRLEIQVLRAQRLEAIGTLAGGIAHNFNNLLMGIQGNASLASLDVVRDHPIDDKLQNIEKLVQSGSKLTNQLLDYAREGRYEVKAVSLNKLIQQTAKTFGDARKDISIHEDLAGDLMGIEADQGQIEQILLNLYINAADAMPEGGKLFLKTVNIKHYEIKNKPYQAKPGNYVLLTVRDTGTGMDQQTMDRIFEPFYTTKGLSRGTGLGLSSVYGIIKGHGGYIDVGSQKGFGTTFGIYLPASSKQVIEENDIKKTITKGEETILLVDDEDAIIHVGEQFLDVLGYEVLTAHSGAEALEIYTEKYGQIDLVILDMVMPEMGGGETYDRLKRVNPEVRVLLSSGYSLNGQAQKILDRGCDGFIQKPFNLEELSHKMREIFDKESACFHPSKISIVSEAN